MSTSYVPYSKSGAGSQRASLGFLRGTEGSKGRPGWWKVAIEAPGAVRFLISCVTLRDE